MFLTSLAIQNARPKQKSYKLADGDGLHLLVQPNGKKLWRLRYRFAGKENMLAFGSLAAVSLANARSKREAARKLLAEGIDPSQQRKHNKLTAAIAARNTFEAIVEEHLKTLENNHAAPATISKTRWLLQDLAAPLARRPIAQITPAEILVILKKIELSAADAKPPAGCAERSAPCFVSPSRPCARPMTRRSRSKERWLSQSSFIVPPLRTKPSWAPLCSQSTSMTAGLRSARLCSLLR